MSNRIDMLGKKYGKLKVVEQPAGNKIVCACDCGVRKEFFRGNVLAGYSKSCGCVFAIRLTKHGLHNGRRTNPEYRTWMGMVDRCYTKSNFGYKWYGARGITVCRRWRRNPHNFIADMGKKPTPQHSIDRKNPNGNYCPSNCRWATKKEQAENRRLTKTVKFGGKIKSLSAWSGITGVSAKVIYYRIGKGWDIGDALNTKPQYGNRRPK